MTQWTDELCRYVGIGAEYSGFHGQHISVSPETRNAVLAAMGFEIRNEAEARTLLEHLRVVDSRHPATPEIILKAAERAVIQVSRPISWTVEAEETAKILFYGKAEQQIDLPPLPMGIHRLILSEGPNDWVTWLLVSPARGVSLSDCTGGSRVWGATTSLYGLTDGGRAGIGNYDLLGGYAKALAGHGADFIGLNPVHAMGRNRPDDVVSPYSPSHREFLNTWHVGTTGPTDRAMDGKVDYPASLSANEQNLRAGFEQFLQLPESSPQHKACKAFEEKGNGALQDYALFEILAVKFGPDWRDWPAAYRDHNTDAIEMFRQNHQEALSSVKWAQWQADCEVQDAQAQSLDAGMRIGLYLDLAVGPRLGGAETWARDTPLVTGASLGAPPDPLSPTGQNWGLAPLNPSKCREQGYAGFARLLRSVMRHAGMIRIDHVLGLMRSFWIPEGMEEGAYVSYPVDALLAVVAIESVRSGTIVIGEDLGLVPGGLREKLARSGIYGMEILQFLRCDAGGFADTSLIRQKAICAFATHDTPTIAGFFDAEDARLQAEIGALDTTAYEEIRADRARAKAALGGEAPVPAIHLELAKANSEIVAVQLDDVAAKVTQQNLPGTIDEHPNWQQSAPFTIERIENSPEFVRLGAEMARAGRANPEKTEKDHDLPDCSNLTH